MLEKNTATWQSQMKKLKLLHIQKTAPGFFEASGGLNMATKPFTEKTDAKLAACIRYCGGASEVEYNFRLEKGRNGYQPIFFDTWKPIRVKAKLDGKNITVEVNGKVTPTARTSAAELFLRTPSFEIFSKWFCSHFPGSSWATIVTNNNVVSNETLSINAEASKLAEDNPGNGAKDFTPSALSLKQNKKSDSVLSARTQCGTPTPQPKPNKI